MFTARNRYSTIRYSGYDSGWVTKKPYFGSRLGLQNFVFLKSSRLALRSTQSPIQCMPAALDPGFKRPLGSRCHASGGVNKEWNYILYLSFSASQIYNI